MTLMIVTFALQRFLDIENALSPGLCIQTALQPLRPVTHLHKNIPITTPPPVSERDSDCRSAESIDFSSTSKISASIASFFCVKNHIYHKQLMSYNY